MKTKIETAGFVTGALLIAKLTIAGFVTAVLLIGSVYAWGMGGYGMGSGMMYGYGHGYGMGTGTIGYGYGEELTDEQRAEIQEKIQELQENGAYPWEIRTEVFNLLQKFGVLGTETTTAPGYGPTWGHGCPTWGHGW